MGSFQPFCENNLIHLFAEAGEEFILLETAKSTQGNNHSYLFTNVKKRLTHRASDDPILFLEQCERYTQKGYFLAGWFSYEFGYGLEKSITHLAPVHKDTILAELGVYTAPQVFDHTASLAIPKTAQSPKKSCTIKNVTLSQNQKQYIEHIHKIKEYILAGDTYQVNYTLKLLFDFLGNQDDLYLQLRRNQQVSFSAYIKQKECSILSFSPELFFKKHNGEITVRPMKGTISRGLTHAEDLKNGIFLQTDLKNRAENIMIVDLLRNDLGRIAQKGMVTPTSLFDIETYNSLLQMTSTIQATVDQDLGLAELFTALFPCGSVTGAPKIRTMEIIKELETAPRGVYTGAIGFLGPNGQSAFNVPIRTIEVQDNKGKMGIGSGIVADSDPINEWQECLLKGQFLTHAPKPFELIETLLWQPESGYALLKQHQIRLKESAQYFNFHYKEEEISRALQEKNTTLKEVSRVRLTLNQEGHITIQATPCPPPTAFDLEPLQQRATQKICFAKQTVSSTNVFLYHKTTNRDWYNKTWAKAVEAHYLDAIYTNEKGEITEGCISNIFVLKNDILRTPPLSAGLLAGVFRQYLLDTFPQQVREQRLYKDDLLAEKTTVFIGNSVRGLIPVQLSERKIV